MNFRYLELMLSFLQNIRITAENSVVMNKVREISKVAESYTNTGLDTFISEHIRGNMVLDSINDKQRKEYIIQGILISLYEGILKIAKTVTLTINEQKICKDINKVLTDNSPEFAYFPQFISTLPTLLGVQNIESMVIY